MLCKEYVVCPKFGAKICPEKESCDNCFVGVVHSQLTAKDAEIAALTENADHHLALGLQAANEKVKVLREGLDELCEIIDDCVEQGTVGGYIDSFTTQPARKALEETK